MPSKMSGRVAARVSGAIAVSVLVAGGVYAAIPSPVSIIRACVGVNGTLRVVPAGERCNARESALSWNQEGVQGPQGPQGVPGLPGPPGAAKAIGFVHATVFDGVAAGPPGDPYFERTIDVVTLPTGKHVITSKLRVTQIGVDEHFYGVSCQMRLGDVGAPLGLTLDTSQADPQQFLAGAGTWATDETMSMEGSFDNAIGFPFVLKIYCWSFRPFTMSSIKAHAVTVNELVQYSYP
jgi:hypothetical protein